MATQLNQHVSALAVAAGGIVVLPHNINDNGLAQIPDVVFRDNGDFIVLATTSTTITVQNVGVGVASCTLLLWKRHTIDRAYGVGPSIGSPFTGVFNLTPLPYIPASGGGGGGGSALIAFRYTVTGLEPSLSDFNITIPVLQPDDTYFLEATLSGATAIVGIDLPDVLAGDRTAALFRFVSTANMTAGDQIDFFLSH